MPRTSPLCLLRLLCLLCLSLSMMAVPAAAENFGGLELGMKSSGTDLTEFEAYLVALESTGDAALVRMAESGRDALRAVQDRDVESFVAAHAVFGYHFETLFDPQRALLRQVVDHLAPAQTTDLTASEKISVTSGCGSEIACDDGSRLSCRCSNASGNCSYNKNSNSWGGSISCDCAGTSSDVSRACRFVPGDGCEPTCDIQCPSGIGFCVDPQSDLCLCAA